MFGKVKPGGVIDSTVGQLGSLGKAIGQQVVKTPGALRKTAATQINNHLEGSEQLEKKSPERKPSDEKLGLKEQLLGVKDSAKDQDKLDLLEQLYGKTETKKPEISVKTEVQ